MRLLNPHDCFWLSATSSEIDVWFKQLEKQRDSAIAFGDLEDARPYLISLIKPGIDNHHTEAIATKREPQPVRLFLVGGKIVGFVVVKEVPKK